MINTLMRKISGVLSAPKPVRTLTLEVKTPEGDLVQYPINSLDEAVTIVNRNYEGWCCEFAHVLGSGGQLVARMIHPNLPTEIIDKTLPYTPCSLLGTGTGTGKTMHLEVTKTDGTYCTLRPSSVVHAVDILKRGYPTCRTAFLWNDQGDLLARLAHPVFESKVFYDALRKRG